MKPKSPKPIRGYGYIRPDGSVCGIFSQTRSEAILTLMTTRDPELAKRVWNEHYKSKGYKPVRVTLSLDTK